nr:MAG TPA: hypothetical protein [Caudoviricetes sp.]
MFRSNKGNTMVIMAANPAGLKTAGMILGHRAVRRKFKIK